MAIDTNALYSNFWSTLISVLYSKKTLVVPATFHERCGALKWMMQNDMTGLINSVLGYAVNTASSTKFSVECDNENVQTLLNKWLDEINLQVEGIPTGLGELAKDYYRERWLGSSFCALRMQKWTELKSNGNTITVPTVMAYVNGASIWVKREKQGNYKLGSDEFFLDSGFKHPLKTTEKEAVVIQKPFNRWFEEYPTPYNIFNGVYKNYLVFETLAHKSEETIAKIVPYLFHIIKNTENLMAQGKLNYTPEQMTEEMQKLKQAFNTYENEPGKTPANMTQADTKYEHLIPEIEPIVKTSLFAQSTRNILSGLGFVEVVPSSTRKETMLNPKPFIAETTAGVDGFKSMLMESIYKVIAKNEKNRKLFSDNNKINIVSSPLKINVDDILDMIRAAYDRGDVSKQSYVESIGFDWKQEVQRRKKEFESGDEDLMYPQIVQNQEATPDERPSLKPATNRNTEKLEKQGKKPGTPEAKNFKRASLDINKCKECKEEIGYYKIGEKGNPICPKCGAINNWSEPDISSLTPENTELEISDKVIGEPVNRQIAKCPACDNKFDFMETPEAGMGYVRCPKCNESVTQKDLETAPYDSNKALPPAVRKKTKHAQDIWRSAFNAAFKSGKDEASCFKIAWNAMNVYLNKNKK